MKIFDNQLIKPCVCFENLHKYRIVKLVHPLELENKKEYI